MGSLGVDIDQAHFNRCQRLIESAVSTVASIAKPAGLATPEHILFRLPDVGATGGKAQGGETHRLQGLSAGQHNQVGPGDPIAITALQRPEQATRLVQVGVVRPAIEGRKTLIAMAGATATIGDPIGTGAVPGQADEQRSVMTPIRRPPLLGIGH